MTAPEAPVTMNIHLQINPGVPVRALYKSDRESSDELRTPWLTFDFGSTDVSVFLPRDLAERKGVLETLAEGIGEAISDTQRQIIEANHLSLVTDAVTERKGVLETLAGIGDDELERAINPPPAAHHRPIHRDRRVSPGGVLNDLLPGAGLEQGDLVVVQGWQYEVTAEGSLEALDSRDPRLIELTEQRRAAEGEGIRRSLDRENEFFTRTQGWDPRGDGP